MERKFAFEVLRADVQRQIAGNVRAMVGSGVAPSSSTARARRGWTPGAIGAAEGLSAYAGQIGMRSAQTRFQYIDAVDPLDSAARAQREALKRADRVRTPALAREILNAGRPSFGPPSGTSGAANHTNPRVTEQARVLGRLGHASLVGSALLGSAEIAAARDRPRAAASVAGAQLGGWAGGVAGAEAGAALGALVPPFGPIAGAAIGGLAGALGGGALGHRAGGDLMDSIRGPYVPTRDQRLRASARGGMP